MKKALPFLIAIIAMSLLSSCSQNQTDTQSAEKERTIKLDPIDTVVIGSNKVTRIVTARIAKPFNEKSESHFFSKDKGRSSAIINSFIKAAKESGRYIVPTKDVEGIITYFFCFITPKDTFDVNLIYFKDTYKPLSLSFSNNFETKPGVQTINFLDFNLNGISEDELRTWDAKSISNADSGNARYLAFLDYLTQAMKEEPCMKTESKPEWVYEKMPDDTAINPQKYWQLKLKQN